MSTAPGLLTGFNCVADESAKILILGSMPGVKSLEQQEYYAHPRNAFWKIIEELFQIPHDLEYLLRLEQLKLKKIALWDVVHQCERPGSLDAKIRPDSVQVNDFKALFDFAGQISKVCFNGAKAAELFKKHVQANDYLAHRDIEYIQLPSTSPANAAMSFQQKLQIWHQIQS